MASTLGTPIPSPVDMGIPTGVHALRLKGTPTTGTTDTTMATKTDTRMPSIRLTAPMRVPTSRIAHGIVGGTTRNFSTTPPSTMATTAPTCVPRDSCLLVDLALPTTALGTTHFTTPTPWVVGDTRGTGTETPMDLEVHMGMGDMGIMDTATEDSIHGVV